MIEYSSPNTNKPLHLGHVRNNLLGWALASIMAANGNKVVKTNIVNDRGIHICKKYAGMAEVWQWGYARAPVSRATISWETTTWLFDKHYKEEVKELMEKGMSEGDQKRGAAHQGGPRDAGEVGAHDPEVRALWRKMNGWVYEGFDQTYKALGVGFDKIYYESETYLEGKER